MLFGGTVPPNSVLFGGTVPPNSFPPIKKQRPPLYIPVLCGRSHVGRSCVMASPMNSVSIYIRHFKSDFSQITKLTAKIIFSLEAAWHSSAPAFLGTSLSQ